MNLTFFGTGYVGLVSGACFAELGHHVTCVDIDSGKIASLRRGHVPIFEPGLPDIVERNTREGRLHFSTDAKAAILHAEILFIAVGTPSTPSGKADLRAVLAVAHTIGRHLDAYKVIVNKSTVPIGTAELVRRTIASHYQGHFDVVSNPEFLREGAAVKDFLNPDRVVIGSASPKTAELMHSLYKDIERPDRPVFVTDPRSAELIKYASNSFLATKISFINELARYAAAVGADIKDVAAGMGLDHRIGPRFLQAGLGFGGSCFPKDLRALIHDAAARKVPTPLLSAALSVNARQKLYFVGRLQHHLKRLRGKTIAVWGLTFKPKTDDIREAPSLDLIAALLKKGARLRAFDPLAGPAVKKRFPAVQLARTPEAAAQGAHALVLVTEWDEFRNPDFAALRDTMKHPLILDGRNIYERAKLEALGFIYEGVGR